MLYLLGHQGPVHVLGHQGPVHVLGHQGPVHVLGHQGPVVSNLELSLSLGTSLNVPMVSWWRFAEDSVVKQTQPL